MRAGWTAGRIDQSLTMLVLAMLTGCGASNDAAEAPDAVAATGVTVARAEAVEFGERFSVSGTLTAERQAQLSARADGLVSRMHVDAGDQVEAGQVLLELDPAVARQALLRARAAAAEAAAAVREAERLLAEAQRLIEHRVIAATEVDARAATLELARASAASARASVREQEEIVARHALPAPFAGVVAEKLTEAGEWVQRGTPVLSLVATDRVRLDLRVPQERFERIDGDTRVHVRADALGGAEVPARVGARVPVTDPDARTFLLRLLLDDPQGRLLPGTSASAEISLAHSDAGAVAIHRDALLRQPDGSHGVYVVEDAEGRSVARRRIVRILHDHDEMVAVAGDSVAVGDRVVIRGNEGLADGHPVDAAER